MSPHPIPWYYRIPLLYIEPPIALIGAWILFTSPHEFLQVVSPRAGQSPTVSTSLAETRILSDQLAIFQLVFAFNLAIVLQVSRDVKVWRVLSAGMLMSDILHMAVSARELGWLGTGPTWPWRPDDSTNFGILGVMALVRLGLVLGKGLGN